MLPHTIIHILQNTALITCLVMTMLLLIEYVNVATRARGLVRLKKSKVGQLLASALLGMVPGCIGGFATVALFTHGVVNFGALVAAMVAGMGDEAFVMYASFPLQALALQGILLALALAAGGLTNLLVKQVPAPFAHNHLAIHPVDEHRHHRKEGAAGSGSWRSNLKNISFQRALLVGGIVFFIVATISGMLEHSHWHNTVFSERWLNLLFLVAAAAALVIIVRVDEHFLEHHLWGHVIKKHFVKIFLWTLGSLIVIAFLERYIGAQAWMRSNAHYMAVAAILIGLIPASGPHLVFTLMFAQGSLPFSVLLANTIVQEGHAGIPLLAESKRGFFYMKAIKIAIAAGASACGILFGF
ncbi:MAG: putative manganese transporter [Prevotellaceae bacterium]|nr:putative manganese transporter [Prevotellaceae bacterium]